MQFFTSAITTLQTLVVALGAGLGVWGVVNLLEGYGSDNPGSKGWGTELARQAYLEAAEAGTPVVTAESGASWCSIQAEHARGSVLYTIRAVGESGTEEQVRTSLDRVLETWLLAPEGEKTSKIC